MNRILFLLLLTVTATAVYGQNDPLTKEELRILDSMFRNDEFIKLITNKERSYVDVNFGIRNGIFSLKNNALNADQAQTDKVYYKPTVGYYHKSGLSLSLSGFISSGEGSLKMYQYAISPGYTYSGKNIAAGISYTRFIEGADPGFEVSPFKNDFYASAVYKKTWIEPGLAAGYSFGKLTEYYDSSFWFYPPLPDPPRIIHIRDTITTKLRGLSISASASHTWMFWELLSNKDGLKVLPTLMLNAGSQRWTITHSSKLLTRFPRLANYLKNRFGAGTGTDKFKIESLAFAGQLTYYYGKFYLQPQLYIDYYLPETTEKRLATMYSITAGFTFH
ncbi:MAG TPA: hypothetical protein VHL77_09720 [Ferruginibacter sp.]|nr:hypothetical protein [Ferruginibacter sp.]